MKTRKFGSLGGIGFAVLAAALYALNAPCSKLLLGRLSPTMTAAFLYWGAGLGMLLLGGIRRLTVGRSTEKRLTRGDLPYTLAMIALDIAAPILLMTGLSVSSAASVSLLNNFEIVATALIALCFFGERIDGRLWLAISLVTAASVLLSFEGAQSLHFSWGAVLVLGACACWGLENNCTRKLSDKDPMEIVLVKGLCSGTGSFLIALLRGESFGALRDFLWALLVGFVAYGLSIFCYIRAQRTLGAARTGAFYAIAPFIGAALSLCIFQERLSWTFFAALPLMAVGAYFAAVKGRMGGSLT